MLGSRVFSEAGIKDGDLAEYTAQFLSPTLRVRLRKENTMNAFEYFTIFIVLRLVIPVVSLFLIGEWVRRHEPLRFMGL
jgi:hypothetical protein